MGGRCLVLIREQTVSSVPVLCSSDKAYQFSAVWAIGSSCGICLEKWNVELER